MLRPVAGRTRAMLTSSTSNRISLAVGEQPRHQILHHLLLAVDGDALADQLAEVDVVQRAVEIEEDAAVEHALAPHALADADLDQEIGHPLLQQPGPDAVLDVVAAAILDDDRIDSGAAEQQRDSTSPAGPAPTIPTWRAHLHRPLRALPSAAAKVRQPIGRRPLRRPSAEGTEAGNAWMNSEVAPKTTRRAAGAAARHKCEKCVTVD